jgi:hypothetical protein
MKKMILLSMLIMTLFIVGCVEQMSDEELESELEELSDEDFDAVMAEDSENSALAGQGYKSNTQVYSLRKKVGGSYFYVKDCSESESGDYLDLTLSSRTRTVPVQSCFNGYAVRRSCNLNVQRGYDIERNSCPNGCEDDVCAGQCGVGLENYPEMFSESGAFSGLFVVGESSPARDILAATDIALSMGLDDVSNPVLDREIDDIYAQNLIVVGSPCVNVVAARLVDFRRDCNEGLSPNEWIIKLIQHENGNYALLVYSYSSYSYNGVSWYHPGGISRVPANFLKFYSDQLSGCTQGGIIDGCNDDDNDGYGIGTGCLGTDCNDQNSSMWNLVGLGIDNDGDNSPQGGGGPGCIGDEVPEGYGIIDGDNLDCNDNDSEITTCADGTACRCTDYVGTVCMYTECVAATSSSSSSSSSGGGPRPTK